MCKIDGFWPGDGAWCEENFVYNHANIDHPDNVQYCCSLRFLMLRYLNILGVKSNVTFYKNVFLYGGQCFMLEELVRSNWIDNVILGSVAQCLVESLVSTFLSNRFLPHLVQTIPLLGILLV